MWSMWQWSGSGLSYPFSYSFGLCLYIKEQLWASHPHVLWPPQTCLQRDIAHTTVPYVFIPQCITLCSVAWAAIWAIACSVFVFEEGRQERECVLTCARTLSVAVLTLTGSVVGRVCQTSSISFSVSCSLSLQNLAQSFRVQFSWLLLKVNWFGLSV